MKKQRQTVTPAPGQRVKILDPFEVDPKHEWLDASVVDLLSTQFTARTMDGKRVLFSFYRDHGVAWRQA